MSAKHEHAAEKIHRHKRGYLPHYDSSLLLQFVTFRLADSLPRDFLKTLEIKLYSKKITEIEYHEKINLYLDLGKGPVWLRQLEIARIVAEAILHLSKSEFELHAWVIMPNHVHILLRVLNHTSLSLIMHSLKGFTASSANKLLDRKGRFWSPDYFDRYIRDRKHYSHVLKYIDENPVKAGLARTPQDWPWGSAGWQGESLR